MRRRFFVPLVPLGAVALVLGGCVESYYFSGATSSGYYPAPTCYSPSFSHSVVSYSTCGPVYCAPASCAPAYCGPKFSSCGGSGYKFGHGGYGKKCW
jgi:hypothetical protein